jgi:hypothetical protein
MESLESRQLMTAAPLGAMPYDTGEFMLGRIAVTPVLVESNGAIDPNSEDWTTAEINQVLQNVRTGMQWWVDTLAEQNTVHSLEFVIDETFATTPVPTSYEPITRQSQAFNQYIGEFLVGQGYDGTVLSLEDAIHQFNHDQRVKFDTDWAFTIFVVDASNDPDGMFDLSGDFRQAFAFAGGLFFVVPSVRPASTYAHETGHMFWARDEYPGGGGYSEKRGYYNTQNTNAIEGAPPGFRQQPSIMTAGLFFQQAYDQNISPAATLAQIGWQDSDGDGIFDVLDVPLALDVAAVYESTNQLLRVRGSATAVPLLNLNSSGLGNDITLNRISRIEYRIDGGSWITASSPDQQALDLDLTLNLSSILQGETFGEIELRAIDAATGITSNVVRVTPERPTAGGGATVEGFAYVDNDNDQVWDPSDYLLPGVSLTIANPDGVFRGRVEPDNTPGAIYSNPLPQLTLSAVGNQTDGRVAAFSGTPGTGTYNFHYGTIFGDWGDAWTEVKQELRITLNEPTSLASIVAVGKGVDSIGRIEGFDADGVLVARSTSQPLALGETETLTLNDPEGRIVSIRAFGANATLVALDDFRFGPAVTATSSVFGTFQFASLPDGSYSVTIESPSSQYMIDQPQRTLVVSGGVAQPLEIRATRATSRWTNPDNPLDVNARDGIQPLDALIVINELNRTSPRPLTDADSTPPYLDVNGDLSVTPIDALRIINYLNRQGGGEGESAGWVAAPPVTFASGLPGADPAGSGAGSADFGGAWIVGGNLAGSNLVGTNFVGGDGMAEGEVTAGGRFVETQRASHCRPEPQPANNNNVSEDQAVDAVMQSWFARVSPRNFRTHVSGGLVPDVADQSHQLSTDSHFGRELIDVLESEEIGANLPSVRQQSTNFTR